MINEKKTDLKELKESLKDVINHFRVNWFTTMLDYKLEYRISEKLRLIGKQVGLDLELKISKVL